MIQRTDGGRFNVDNFSVCRVIHRSGFGNGSGQADPSLADRWWGWVESQAANDFLDPGVGVDEPDLSQDGFELPLKVLGRGVFLPELVAEVVPAQPHAIGLADAAKPVGQPGVDVQGQGGMLQR